MNNRADNRGRGKGKLAPTGRGGTEMGAGGGGAIGKKAQRGEAGRASQGESRWCAMPEGPKAQACLWGSARKKRVVK